MTWRHTLLDYHHRCADAVSELATVAKYVLDDSVWIRLGAHNCESVIYALGAPLIHVFALWWIEFLEDIKAKLCEVPHRATLSLSAAEPFLAKADSCRLCRKRARRELPRYLEILGDGIDKSIAEVRSSSYCLSRSWL